MRFFLISTWSNQAYVVTKDGVGHDIYPCRTEASLSDALDWCRNNRNYAGHEGQTSYVPWHWSIEEWGVPGVPSMGKHFTLDLHPCDTQGQLLCPVQVKDTDDDLVEAYSKLADKVTDLEGCYDENRLDIQLLKDRVVELENQLAEGSNESVPRRHKKQRPKRLGRGKKSGLRSKAATKRPRNSPVSRS